MSSPRSRRARVVATLLATGLAGAALLMPVPVASGAPVPLRQDVTAGDPVLNLVDIDSWVPADGTFRATFDLPPATPLDAEVVWTVHQPLGGRFPVRERIREIDEGGDPGRPLQRTVRRALAESLDADGRLELSVPVRSRSGDASRLLLPNPGVHPVSVALVDPDGATVARTVVFLVRLPADPVARPGAIGLLLRLDTADPVVDAAGEPTLGLDDRAAVRAATDLLPAAEGALSLAVRPGLPATLMRVDAGGARAVDALRTAAQESTVLRSTYTRLHFAGLVGAGGVGEMQADLVRGDDALNRLVRRPDGRIWPPDTTLSQGSLDALRAVGVDRVLVEPTQVADAPEGPVVLRLGADGPAAIRLDEGLGLALVEDDRGPAVVANRIAADVAGAWFDADGRAALAVEVPTAVDPARLSRVVEELADGPLVRLAPLGEVFDVDTGERPEARLVDPAGSDVGEILNEHRLERRRLTAAASMFPEPSAFIAGLDEVLSASLVASLPTNDRRSYLGAVSRGVDTIAAAVAPPEERSVTVTSRRASIPLRLSNGLDQPIEVRLELRSPLLEFPEGRVVSKLLMPGENRVEVPVVARGSGQFVLNVEVVSPDGGLDLAEGRIRIRSTAFSGAGAAIGFGALVVLLVWWFRTARRSRRDGDGEGDGSGGDGPADPSGDTTGMITPVEAASGAPGSG